MTLPFDLATLTAEPEPKKPQQPAQQGEPAFDLAELDLATLLPDTATTAASVVGEDSQSSLIRQAYRGIRQERPDATNIGQEFVRGVKRGFAGLGLSSLGQMVEAVGSLEPTVTDPRQPFVVPAGPGPIAQAMQGAGERIEQANAPAVPSFRDVGKMRMDGGVQRDATVAEKAGDFLKYAGSASGELLGTSITTILSYLSGGAPAAAGSSYVLNTGDIRKELSDLDVNGPKREAVAFLAGVPVAALDAFGLDHWAKFLKQKLAGAIAERAAATSAKSTIKEVFKAAAEGGAKSLAAETPTEVAQEGIQHIATRAAADKPVAEGLRERLEDTAVQVAVGAGITGAAGGGGGAAITRLKRPGAKKEAPKTEPVAEEESAPTIEAVNQAIEDRKRELAAMPTDDPERGGVESSLKVLESQRRTLLGEPDPDAKPQKSAAPIVERPKVQRELDEDLDVAPSVDPVVAKVQADIEKAGGTLTDAERRMLGEDVARAKEDFEGEALDRELKGIVQFHVPPKPSPAPSTSAAPAKPDVSRAEPRPFPAEDAADDESRRTREVTQRLAEGRPGAIDFAAQEMAPRVPQGAVLVPVPNAEGTTKANRELADAIKSYGQGLTVVDVLTRAEPAASDKRLSADEEVASIMRTRRLPKAATGPVFLVDALETTGARMHGARVALERADAQSLTFAKAPIPEGLTAVGAEASKAAIAKKQERAKNRYSGVGDVGKLLQELSMEQQRLDDDFSKVHVFARDEGNYVATGHSISSGRALGQTRHTTKRIEEIEASLREMGIADEDITAARSDPDVMVEMLGKLTESTEDDASFDLAELQEEEDFRFSLERQPKQSQVSPEAARDRADTAGTRDEGEAEAAARPDSEPGRRVAQGGGVERTGASAPDAGRTAEHRPGDDDAREARDEAPAARASDQEPELKRPRLHRPDQRPETAEEAAQRADQESGRGLTPDEELELAVENGEITQQEAERRSAFRRYSDWRKTHRPAVAGDDIATFDEWLVDGAGYESAKKILGREPEVRGEPEPVPEGGPRLHSAFGVAKPAPIIEEQPTPEVAAERASKTLEHPDDVFDGKSEDELRAIEKRARTDIEKYKKQLAGKGLKNPKTRGVATNRVIEAERRLDRVRMELDRLDTIKDVAEQGENAKKLAHWLKTVPRTLEEAQDAAWLIENYVKRDDNETRDALREQIGKSPVWVPYAQMTLKEFATHEEREQKAVGKHGGEAAYFKKYNLPNYYTVDGGHELLRQRPDWMKAGGEYQSALQQIAMYEDFEAGINKGRLLGEKWGATAEEQLVLLREQLGQARVRKMAAATEYEAGRARYLKEQDQPTNEDLFASDAPTEKTAAPADDLNVRREAYKAKFKELYEWRAMNGGRRVEFRLENELGTALKKYKETLLEVAKSDPDITPHDTLMVKAARRFTADIGATADIDTPARAKLRDRAIDTSLERVRTREYGSAGKKMAMVLGLPGSGKTSLVVKYLAQYLDAGVSDIDVDKALFLEFAGGWGSESVYREAGQIVAAKVRAQLQAEGFNYITPGVGTNTQDYLDTLDALHAQGYEVHIVHVAVPTAVAQERAVKRFEDGGHFVRPEYIEFVGRKDYETYEAAKRHPAVVGYAQIDNSRSIPRVVEEHNADGWLRLAKGVERGAGATGDDSAVAGDAQQEGVADAAQEPRDDERPRRAPAKAGQVGPSVSDDAREERSGATAGVEGVGPAGEGRSERGRAGSDGVRADLRRAAGEGGAGEGVQEPAGAGPAVPERGRGDRAGERDRGEPGVGPSTGGGLHRREHGELVGGSPAPEAEQPHRVATPAGEKPPKGSNYRLTDADDIGGGARAEKVRQNIAAIRLLRELQESGRAVATPDEQAVLAKYVGWGAFPNYFDQAKAEYRSDEGKALRELLNDSEYARAKASTTNAHYTSPEVVKAMWDVMRQFGLTQGKVLEPAVGVGNFIGFAPTDMKLGWVAIEKDTTTGHIAKYLYPESDVHVAGYEDVALRNGMFDVAISNVPFGQFAVYDPHYKNLKGFSIHDYFFAKTLDKVRPGGIVAFITSRFTLDKAGQAVRKYIAERADFLGAIRLPYTAFKGNAGTEVVADIIFLRVRAKGAKSAGHLPAWQGLAPIQAEKKKGGESSVSINEYFAANPHMMLGTPELRRGQFTEEDFVLTPNTGTPLGDQIRFNAKTYLPQGALVPATQPVAGAQQMPVAAAPAQSRPGTYMLHEGQIVQVGLDGNLVDAEVPKSQAAKVRALIELRDRALKLIKLNTTPDTTDAQIESERVWLERSYRAFVAKYGPINLEKRTSGTNKLGVAWARTAYPNRAPMSDDPSIAQVMALEDYDADTDTAKPAALITKGRVIPRANEITRADTGFDAIVASLGRSGRLDLDYMAGLRGVTVEQLQDELRGEIYEDPATGQWEIKAKYLSGNVRDKLEIAKRAAKQDKRFKANVEALLPVVPADTPHSLIKVRFGARWIRGAEYADFIKSLLGAEGAQVTVTQSEATGVWEIVADHIIKNGVANNTTYGTSKMSAIDIIEASMNSKSLRIVDQVKIPGGGTQSVPNKEQTALAIARQQALLEKFRAWLFTEDQDRSAKLVRRYNDSYNNTVDPKYDGRMLMVPGIATHINGVEFNWFDHQKNAIMRFLQNGNILLAHAPGAGKTYTFIAMAMEARRLGFARRPMVAVPNHMLPQATREAQQLYPGARILALSTDDTSSKAKALLAARAASNEWDIIITTHNGMGRIPMSKEAQVAFLEAELQELRDALTSEVGDARNKGRKGHGSGRKSRTVKQIEAIVEDREARIKALMDAPEDTSLTFEELGVDLLIVDEAHEFKNLNFATRVEGIQVGNTKAATWLHMKTQYLHTINPTHGVVFATGTPVTNSIAELWTMQRYVNPKGLRERGLERFDDWQAIFGMIVSRMEKNTVGAYEVKSRLARYVNVPAMIQMFREFADVKTIAELGLPRPPLLGGKFQAVVSQEPRGMKAFLAVLRDEWEALKKMTPEEAMASGMSFLSIGNKARAAGLDMRLVDGSYDASDGPFKVDDAADRIFERYEKHNAYKGVQIVFLDMSVDKGPNAKNNLGGRDGFSVYAELKRQLIAKGIPEKEIAFSQSADTDAKKKILHQKVNDGEIRVIVGSTRQMGFGTNVQKRLVALHRLDVPWRPDQIEQSEARILRMGNILYKPADGSAPKIEGVEILRYVTEGSYDQYSWDTVLRKAKFIAQAMAGDGTVAELDELADESSQGAQLMAALASNNPLELERADLAQQVAELQALAHGHRVEQSNVQRQIADYEYKIKQLKREEVATGQDAKRKVDTSGDKFRMKVGSTEYTDRKEAGSALVFALAAMDKGSKRNPLAEIGGFRVTADVYVDSYFFRIDSATDATFGLEGEVSVLGIVARIENAIKALGDTEPFPRWIAKADQQAAELRQLVGRPFERAADLEKAEKRLIEVEAELLKQSAKAPPPDAPPDEDYGGGDAAPEEGGGEPLYAVGDPFTATFLLARRVWQGIVRDGDPTPLVASSIPDVEKRWREARGVQPESIRQQAGGALEALKKLGRHFPEINPSRSPLEAAAHELLLEHERAPKWAQAVAYDRIAGVTEDLTKPEADLLARVLILPDIIKDVEAGLYRGKKPLPFGYVHAQQIERDLARYNTELKKHPKVAAARDKRRAFVRQLTREMVDADLLPASVLSDERYYHRQVMAYVSGADKKPFVGATKGKEVRARLRGFQRGRTGGGDFNTSYVEAEYEWVAQALTELKTKATLEQLKELADRSRDLKVMARRENMVRLGDKLAEEAGLDPSMEGAFEAKKALSPFAQKIAIGTGKVLSAIADGEVEVEGFDDLLNSVSRAYLEWKESDSEGPFNAGHPRWWPFLAALVKTNGPGASGAAMIFKGIAERDAFMRKTLGSDYINPKPMSRDDWEALAELAPEGYVTWQPEEGNHFFEVHSFDEKAIATALSGERELTEQDRRSVMAMGGAKETWIIPDWLAATLNQFGVQPYAAGPVGALDRAWTRAIGLWKQHVLLFPTRFGRYNLNNFSGDVDAALAYSPAILKRVPAAARDLFHSMFRRTAPEGMNRAALDAQMQKLVELGVIDQGLTALEIPDVNDLPAFERLANSDPKTFMGFLLSLGPKYFKHARRLTQYRENILRLAAFRYFDERIQGGARNLYAASNPARVDAVKKDPKKYAALLARDLIGDYQAVSSWTQWMRNRGLPFFSFQEVNFKRYLRLVGNIAREGEGDATARTARLGAVLSLKVGRKAAVRAFQINMFMFTIALWNSLFFDDEDEELRRENRDQLHLILGRDEDTNEIISMRIEGAFASLLGWLDLQDYIEDVHDVVKKDAELAEKAADAVKAPINRIVQLWEPLTKGVGELLSGRKLYPDVFRPRPIRDKGEHVAGMLALDRIYNTVTGKPAPKGHWLAKMFVYRTDPGEAAYYDTRTRAAKWLEKNGKERSAPDPKEKANALYYWKRAVQWGDEKAATKWRARYFELGGSLKGMMQSIQRSEPLGAIALRDRRRFLRELDANDRAVVEMAEEWYRRVYGGRGSRLRLVRPSVPAATDTTAPAESTRFRLRAPGAM